MRTKAVTIFLMLTIILAVSVPISEGNSSGRCIILAGQDVTVMEVLAHRYLRLIIFRWNTIQV